MHRSGIVPTANGSSNLTYVTNLNMTVLWQVKILGMRPYLLQWCSLCVYPADDALAKCAEIPVLQHGSPDQDASPPVTGHTHSHTTDNFTDARQPTHIIGLRKKTHTSQEHKCYEAERKLTQEATTEPLQRLNK